MEEEIWRPVPGRESSYEVSCLGRIRSLDRTIVRRTQHGPVQARLQGRVLRPGRTRAGYLTVVLAGRSVHVHCVVLQAFTGPRPAGHEVAHGDGDRSNNAVTNLRWATPKENAADKIRHGTTLRGEKNPGWAGSHCKCGHAFERYANGRRVCKTCKRNHYRQHRGTRPGRHRDPIRPRLSEGLRLIAQGMAIKHAARIVKVGRNTLGRALRSGTQLRATPHREHEALAGSTPST